MLTSRPHIVVEDLRNGWGSRVLMEHVNFEVERAERRWPFSANRGAARARCSGT